MNKNDIKTVFVTGGAGYVGSALVPKLLELGYKVKVFDLFLYGESVLDAIKDHPGLELIKGDIRDKQLVEEKLAGCEAMLHLACISNDPSFELNPELGKSINLDAFYNLIEASQKNKIKRFIYASSSSVYGVKDEEKVTEELSLDPLTDYSKFKAECEEILLEKDYGFVPFIVRPATVCGYSPRVRLDVIVNILTNHAYHNRKILIYGGKQVRPNIHIEDMCNFYIKSLEWSDEQINRKIYNVGYKNFTVSEIAQKVKNVVGDDVEMEVVPTDDIRSYRVCSDKIKDELGFEATHSLEDAMTTLIDAFKDGRIKDSFNNTFYFNIKRMQEVDLK